MSKIPTDTIWKRIILKGKEYIVPDFGKMRNKLRKK